MNWGTDEWRPALQDAWRCILVDRNPKPLAATPPGPYIWHEFQFEDETRVYRQEAIDALKRWQPEDDLDGGSASSISKELLGIRVAEYKRLIAQAKDGAAANEEWNPAGSNPVVWEIKMDYGDEHFRFYFAEPPQRPRTMVALAAQHKDVNVPGPEIQRVQTCNIQKATDRYNAGYVWQWGLDAVGEQRRHQLDHIHRGI